MKDLQSGPHTLCLIEDDELVGESLAARFRLEGFVVDWWRDGATARRALGERRYAAVVSDIRLPDCNGGDLYLDLSRRSHPLPPFLFMTGFGTIDRAVELLKAGAVDYVTKPFDADMLVARVRRLAQEHGPAVDPSANGELGVSAAMQRIAASIPQLARRATALLLSGESGVGKEHVARLYHRCAGGSELPFVAVNCGAIPEPLLEAELFGFERGAFTGAVKSRHGYFEQAHGGTLFLDEVGDMPASMQVKLLRVLQERRVQRVGGSASAEVDFRLVCASHRDLKAMVRDGLFREDLYYRINVIHLRIPPLRERTDDVRWFVRRFIDAFNERYPEMRRRLDPRTEQALLSYAWPGNVRELKHAVERACILSPGPLLEAEAFFGDGLQACGDTRPPSASLVEYLMDCEREYLRIALDRHDWHMTHTAEALGISRKSLWDKMRRLAIQAEQREDASTPPRARQTTTVHRLA